MTNKIFKALPMRQDGVEIGALKEYIQSLCCDAIGFKTLSDELECDTDFQTVLDILCFLGNNDTDEKVWKREVLKATNLLNRVSERCGEKDG